MPSCPIEFPKINLPNEKVTKVSFYFPIGSISWGRQSILFYRYYFVSIFIYPIVTNIDTFLSIKFYFHILLKPFLYFLIPKDKRKIGTFFLFVREPLTQNFAFHFSFCFLYFSEIKNNFANSTGPAQLAYANHL